MIQVRRKTYRGEPGWAVSGQAPPSLGGLYPVSIFTPDEATARAIADAYRVAGREAAELDYAAARVRRDALSEQVSDLLRRTP